MTRRPSAADDLAAVLAEMDADLPARRREPVPAQMPAILRQDGKREPVPHPFAHNMDMFQSMASSGLELEQIAAAFGYSAKVLEDALLRWPDLRRDYEQARAQGIAKAAGVLAQLVEAGDLEAVKFLLKAKGGFNAPRDPAGPGVVINLGSLPATVTTINADRLAEEQRAILEAPDDEPAAQD
jgi:hypothetical protein